MARSNQAAVKNLKSKPRSFEVVNYLDKKYQPDIVKDVREGLTAPQKFIPCKYFYDARGSKLFEDICRLPEYYLTRTEISILKDIAPGLMETSTHKDLVELGSGADWKIRILLEAAGESNRSTLRYIPVDISESAVIEAAQGLLEIWPRLEVLGVVADFTRHLEAIPTERPVMYCFLGSTIGNLDEHESTSFLRSISDNMKLDDRLLIGFDMLKPREILEAAYNDSQGVTSEFNKNILSVINSALSADFNPSHFGHLAFFNEEHSRIEMHLRASCDFSVKLESLGMEIDFKKGETIHTENSRKFTRASIEEMASQARLSIENWYSDPDAWFSIVTMALDPRRNS